VQSRDEIVHIGARHFPAHSVVTADLIRDARFVVAALHEFENPGSDEIQAEHLAVMDIQQNPSVHCLCLPDGVGYSEHGIWRPDEFGLISPCATDSRIRWTGMPETNCSVRCGVLLAVTCCEDGG
jgi:hypothetical protein